MRPPRLLVVLAVAGIACEPLPAQAAPASGGTSTDALLLGELPSVFGASRFDQLSTEAPASVSVVTRDDIAARGWRTLGELLQTVRGFYVNNDGVYATLGARGFGVPGDYNARVLLVIDGHRVNENIFESGPVGFEGPVLLDDVERVEVIRGPASSLYGAGAFFGVINVVTTRGRAVSGARVRAAAESFGTRDGVATAGTRFANGIEFRTTLASRRGDGRDFTFPELQGPGGPARAIGLDDERRDRASLRLDWGSLTVTGFVNDRRKGLATGRYVTDVGVDGSEMRDRFSMLGATWDRTLSPAHALRVTGSLNAYAYRGAFMYDSARNNDFADGRWAIVDAQHTTTALARHRLVAGVQLIRSFGQEQGYFTAGTRTFADDARESILAAYVQDEFRLTERWIVNGGLRLDRYTSFGTAFNPRLALIRTFRRGSAVKLLYGRAFRAPSVFERRYEGPDVRPNALLRPERIETIELLAEHLVSANWKVTTALFRNDASRLIGLEDVGTDVVQYRNSRSARAQGIEGEVEFERQGVRARATGVLQRATARPGDATLPNAPHTLATVDLTIPVSRRIGGSIELRHVGARRSAFDTPSDAYTVANAWLSIRLPVAGARLGAGVYNVFDTRYDDPASADFRQTAIPQAPRHVRVSLDVGTR